MQIRNVLLSIAMLAWASTTVVAGNDGQASISVKQTPDKITITGGKGKKTASEKFPLKADEWYIIKIAYTGTGYGNCQLGLVTQSMIDTKQTVGGLLTNWMGPKTTEIFRSKGSAKSENYMIYVEAADGPWTVEIYRKPKPSPVGKETTFSGTTNKITPFFHLKKGHASFTMHQKLNGRFAARLQVELFNADDGTFVADLCHNSTDPTLHGRADVPADGNYVMEVNGGDTWDVSYTQ